MLRIVQTENGTVRGLPAADPRVTSFKGIPYAAPPVGDNRWRAPQPCPNWDGVRDAYDFAPISLQDTPGLGTDIYCREWHVDANIPISEDSLYLNVWTNATSTTDRLPVLVFIHGGALQWGYSSEMEFDGERIARRGIVVVTMNYRLAVMGFLAHPDISEEQPDAPANFGNLDQQAALRWVQRNIAAFGGDPNNVTLGGQSAGGFSVLAQMASDTKEILFHKAIVISGMIRNPYETDLRIAPKSLRQAEQAGVEFFKTLGVSSLKEARQLDAFYIREKYAPYAQPCLFMPCIDGVFCKEDPYVTFLTLRRHRIPVIAGNTIDEFFGFINALDEAELTKKSEEIFADKAKTFLDFPESKTKVEQGYAPANSIETGIKAAFHAEQMSDSPVPCYYYRFMPDIPGDDHPGAFHSCDLWFFFETLAKCSRPYQGKHYDLARLMCNYISNFIKSGDPNGLDSDGSTMPLWAPYQNGHRAGIEFGDNGAVPSDEENPYMIFLSEHLYQNITGKEQ